MFGRKRKTAPAAPPPPPPGQFTARYPGECAACGTRINVGDTAGKVHMARRRIGQHGIADDPHERVCCGPCHADAAVNGDPSLRW